MFLLKVRKATWERKHSVSLKRFYAGRFFLQSLSLYLHMTDGLLMILSVFSKLNDSVILYTQAQDY